MPLHNCYVYVRNYSYNMGMSVLPDIIHNFILLCTYLYVKCL